MGKSSKIHLKSYVMQGALMHFWAGLYAAVDRVMLINGVITMLKVLTGLLLSKDSTDDKQKHLKYGDRQDDEAQNI